MKKLLFVFLYSFTAGQLFSQSIGSKVKIVTGAGTEYTGIIKEINGDKYKVKYDGFDFEAWLVKGQFTVLPNSTENTPAQTNNPPAQNNRFRAGEKVEAQDFQGKWYKAEILEVTAIGYKIHYEGYSVAWDEEVPPARVRARSGQVTTTNGGNTGTGNTNQGGGNTGNKPVTNGTMPSLPGTHWAIQTAQGNLPTFEFCMKGSWTLGNYRGGDEYGKYRISGGRLILHNEDGELWGNFSMKWDGNMLTLSEGTRVFKLIYKGQLNPC